MRGLEEPPDLCLHLWAGVVGEADEGRQEAENEPGPAVLVLENWTICHFCRLEKGE
jgi:hypothetical protein